MCKFWQDNFLIKSAQAASGPLAGYFQPAKAEEEPDLTCAHALYARSVHGGEMMQFQSSTVSCKNREKGAAKWLM